MPRRFLLVLFAIILAAAGCSSDDDDEGTAAVDGPTVNVTLSDTGCEPRAITTPAGPTNFHVTNKGSAAVTEFEILQGSKIVGEVENVIPGADRSFGLTLKAGTTYTTKCPGGSSFEAGTIQLT